MLESLRILLSAVFLSAVFLGAYYYVNTPANERAESIASLLGGKSNADSGNTEDIPLPSDMGNTAPAIPATPATDSNYPGNAAQINTPFQNNSQSGDLMLPAYPEENLQSAPVSAPYGSSAAFDPSAAVQATQNTPASQPPYSEIYPANPGQTIPAGETVSNPNSNPVPNAFDSPASTNSIPNADPNRAIAANFIQQAQAKINQGEILPTLQVLSKWYNAPQFTQEEQNQIHLMLMKLAGEVVYLHPEKYFNPYIIQPGDTISSIAAEYQIPWQLLAKLNGLNSPYHVQPGAAIKVVRGPFNAEVHLSKSELTLWLPLSDDTEKSIYAGTFHIGQGADCPKMAGDYIINEKIIDPEYRNNGTTYGSNDPNNPYGNRLMTLTCLSDPNHAKIGIHGTNNSQYIRKLAPYGFICLSPRDINDLYDILGVGSRVRVQDN